MIRRHLSAPLLAAALAGSSLVYADEPDQGLPPPPLPKKKLAALQPRVLPPTIMTEFDPRRDGMPFPNNGDYASPDGDCFGMSLLAINAYYRRLAEGREGERRPEPPIVKRIQDAPGDLKQAAAAAAIQKLTDDRNEDGNDNPQVPQRRAAEQLIPALQRIAKTGEPEVMGIYGKDGSHAFVLFGYRNGKLQLYDPNYPGETLEWPFDEVRGLGRHPKADEDSDLYGPKSTVSSTPADRYPSNADVERLRAACSELSKECTDHFPTVTASLEGVRDGKNGPRVAVVGRVSGGLTKTDAKTRVPPQRVWLTVNGQPVAAGRIEKDGTFRLLAPASAFDRERNEIRIVATAKGSALAGFTEQTTGAPPRPSQTPGMNAAVGKAGAAR